MTANLDIISEAVAGLTQAMSRRDYSAVVDRSALVSTLLLQRLAAATPQQPFDEMPGAIVSAVSAVCPFLAACRSAGGHGGNALLPAAESAAANLLFKIVLLSSPRQAALLDAFVPHLPFLVHAARLQLAAVRAGALVIESAPSVSVVPGDEEYLSAADAYVWLACFVMLLLGERVSAVVNDAVADAQKRQQRHAEINFGEPSAAPPDENAAAAAHAAVAAVPDGVFVRALAEAIGLCCLFHATLLVRSTVLGPLRIEERIAAENSVYPLPILQLQASGRLASQPPRRPLDVPDETVAVLERAGAILGATVTAALPVASATQLLQLVRCASALSAPLLLTTLADAPGLAARRLHRSAAAAIERVAAVAEHVERHRSPAAWVGTVPPETAQQLLIVCVFVAASEAVLSRQAAATSEASTLAATRDTMKAVMAFVARLHQINAELNGGSAAQLLLEQVIRALDELEVYCATAFKTFSGATDARNDAVRAALSLVEVLANTQQPGTVAEALRSLVQHGLQTVSDGTTGTDSATAHWKLSKHLMSLDLATRATPAAHLQAIGELSQLDSTWEQLEQWKDKQQLATTISQPMPGLHSTMKASLRQLNIAITKALLNSDSRTAAEFCTSFARLLLLNEQLPPTVAAHVVQGAANIEKNSSAAALNRAALTSLTFSTICTTTAQ